MKNLLGTISLNRLKKRVLKKSTIGFEVELFIVDKQGKIANNAPEFLNHFKEHKIDIDVVQEVTKNFIELGSFPTIEGPNSMLRLLSNMENLLLAAEKLNLAIYPLATYPGKVSPQISEDLKYEAQKKIFGAEKFKITGRCTGFHCHYALPRGVFDSQKLILKKLINSKNKESLVNAYNILIALDPALSTFMQSSPFYQGKYIGKDSRLIKYRGDEILDSKSLYIDYPEFGILPNYQNTGTDLIEMTEMRNKRWLEILTEKIKNEKEQPKYKSILDTCWAPVKINSHGTLEQRGMDMNYPRFIIAAAIIIRHILKLVQEEFYQVVPDDSAVQNPFRVEKKTIYIPPDSYVKNKLQHFSAYKGMENEEIFNYCKRLLALANQIIPKKKKMYIEPFEEILSNKETISDRLIKEAKQQGHKDLTQELPPDIVQFLVQEHTKKLFKEVIFTKKQIENY